MNYSKLQLNDASNGIGIRATLYVSGCTHHCPGCHNHFGSDIDTWDYNAGELFTAKTLDIIIDYLNRPDANIAGLTLSGGDPLAPKNREAVAQIARIVSESCPGKTIWCYTGYLYEQVSALPVMDYIDVLVDGPFLLEHRDLMLKWRGSSNQRVIRVPETRHLGQIVLLENT